MNCERDLDTCPNVCPLFNTKFLLCFFGFRTIIRGKSELGEYRPVLIIRGNKFLQLDRNNLFLATN